MDENVKLYEVQSGDNLEKIAEKFGMSSDQLKDFHNRNCGKMEKLWFNNLIGIKQIVVPKNHRNSDSTVKQQDHLLPSHLNDTFHASFYNVSDRFESIFTPNFEITYTVDIDYQKKEDQTVLLLETKNFKKNGEHPDDKMSAVALECMEAISPIPFVVNADSSISKIFDFPELKNKFNSRRADLEDFFTGEIYQSYFNKFSESLENENYINTQLLTSLLHQFLFPKLDWFHKTHDWNENLYFVQGSFALNCHLNAEYFEDNEEMMETKITGRIDENCSPQEVLRGSRWEDEAEKLVAGKIEIIYRTSKKTKQLISCDVNTELLQDEEVLQKRNLKISI